jgi:exosortase
MSVLQAFGLIALLASFSLLYWPVLGSLVRDWWQDDNYSHGFLIIPLALYFAWERRALFLALTPQPALTGVVVVAFGLALLIGGVLGAELFLTRISLVVVLAGVALFLHGRRALRVWLFPIAFLLLMIPVPAIIFNQVAFPLQLLASRVGEIGLQAAGVPVLREGNVIVLARTSLEVAEACSGIRSLISLLTLGIVYGYFTDPRPGMRVLIALMTVPVAVITNGARVAGTGIAAHYYGAEAAEGFFHTFSGWMVFVAALAMLLVLSRVLTWVAPRPRLVDALGQAMVRAGS